MNNIHLFWDSRGNRYVSSWSYKAVYRHDYNFTNHPELVVAFSDAPADIYVNKVDDILAAPLYYTSQLELVDLLPAKVGTIDNVKPSDYILFSAYPNPFNGRSVLNLNLPLSTNLRRASFDRMGREVVLIHRGYLERTEHAMTFEANNISSGVYCLTVRGGNMTLT